MVGNFDASQQMFAVTHRDGSRRMHSLSDAKRWKLFSRVENPKACQSHWNTGHRFGEMGEKDKNDMKGVTHRRAE